MYITIDLHTDCAKVHSNNIGQQNKHSCILQIYNNQ